MRLKRFLNDFNIAMPKMSTDKNILEHYPRISIFWLKKKGFLEKSCKGWLRNEGHDYMILIETNIEDYKPCIWLSLKSGNRSTPEQKITLFRTPCNYGGWRFWFQCHLPVAATGGLACGKRVGVLYSYSNSYFGCRDCLNMTYHCRTMNKSNSWYNLFRFNRMVSKLANVNLKEGRSRYKGKLTWRYRRIMHLQERFEAEAENLLDKED